MLMVADDIKVLTVTDTEGTGRYIRDRVKDDQAVVLADIIRVSAVAVCSDTGELGLS